MSAQDPLTDLIRHEQDLAKLINAQLGALNNCALAAGQVLHPGCEFQKLRMRDLNHLNRGGGGVPGRHFTLRGVPCVPNAPPPSPRLQASLS